MDQEAIQQRSVSRTFSNTLLLVYLIGVLAVVPIIYFLTKNELYKQAHKELNLLVDAVDSTRAVVKETIRPYFLPKGEFFAPVVSSTVMAKEFASQFSNHQPNYLVRMVSDNPLNPENLPKDLERKVLDQLRKGGSEKGFVETGTIKGRTYLISAHPTKVQDDCLICHGNPDAAPREITAKYGTANGFGWKTGEIVGATLVGVPITDLNVVVIERSAIVIGIITVLFAGALIVLNRVVNSNIIQPILDITSAAKAISHGKSNEPLTSDRKDEIGALTRAFELMRRSISIANDQIIRLSRKS